MSAIKYLVTACVYAAVFTAITFSANAFAQTFDFTIDVPTFYTINGQFVTTLQRPNTYMVTGISGMFSDGQVITGVDPSFDHADQLLYYPASDPYLVDVSGISFTTGSGATLLEYNVFSDNTQYQFYNGNSQNENFPATLTVTPALSVPESSTYVLLSSLIPLIPILRRYRLKAV